jgi:hypothetical protein
VVCGCTEIEDLGEISESIEFRSTETRLRIPAHFYHRATVPWTAYNIKPGQTVSSITLERKLSAIEGLDLQTDSNGKVLIFGLSAWFEEDLRNRDIVLARLVALANHAERIVPVGETGLLRAYERNSTIYWLLIDKRPPVSAENIVASCTSSTIREEAARCSLIKFYPMSDVVVSLRLDEKLVPQRSAIVGDILKLVRSWEVAGNS